MRTDVLGHDAFPVQSVQGKHKMKGSVRVTFFCCSQIQRRRII